MNEFVIPLGVLWIGVTGMLVRAAFLCAGKGVAAGRDFLILLVIATPIFALIIAILKGAQ